MEKSLVDSAVEQFPSDIKAVNFILGRIQKAHLNCDFRVNGSLIVNHGFEMVKNVPVSELGEDGGISVFYSIASYLHKRHFNFMSTVTNPRLDIGMELTHVSTIWNEELDGRLLTKPDIAKEIIQTMEDYAGCNSSQSILTNLYNWKEIASKTNVMLENDIFIINNEE